MFFCEKCRYLFNVTKDVKSKQIGGKINEALTSIFNKYKKNEPLVDKDLKKLKSKDLFEDERFERMNKKEQRRMISFVKATDKEFFSKEEPVPETKIGSNVAYFICKYCKNYKLIKPGTLIYSKNYDTSAAEVEDYTYAIYDYTLPRTKNYICKNENCPTHKDDSKKEAVLTKNLSEQVIYICTVCSTYWTNIV
ncbi:MAG: DNA-dependent RNA polymerase subunit Rpb9 [Satyrvirus sp.]|uniref:DNA-dependent RNA polymerase subunit Rpb9 n=1 Tax=Satyrvirus sp. TaxID=2487771 RepID=A0A3G5AEI6_9VIRU|nr:MAG: DNA-dependent RNA polymerase subunit Rpb9 [Satyrvirus sp.]